MTLGQLTLSALVGLMAAFLASRLVTEHGYGVVGDIVAGVSGALIGAVVLGAFITRGVLAPLGIAGGSPVAQIIIPLIGAVVLLAVLRVVRTSPWAALPCGLPRAAPYPAMPAALEASISATE
jgi:uncharacterized membrane protein YeaQ/YmgE (transglycosylase-associated protein family)